MERGIGDIITELRTVNGALLQKACGALLLKNSLIHLVDSVAGVIAGDDEEELNGVIGLIDSISESLEHTAEFVLCCADGLQKITEANVKSVA